MRTFLIIALFLTAPFFGPCSKKRPAPVPTPTPVEIPSPTPTATPTATPTPEASPTATPISSPSPSPVASPSPIAIATPTPVPVPSIDLAPFVHAQGGKTVEVEVAGGVDAATVISAADQFDGPGKVVIKATARASIKKQIFLKHDSEWIGEFQCDTDNIWHGCVMLEDDVFVEGSKATIYGPTFISDTGDPNVLGHPATTIFMTLSSTLMERKLQSRNVTIRGFHFIGRQTHSDGGMRQTVSFGNCDTCASIENDFYNDPSIGVGFGMTASEGTRAKNVLVYKNKHRRFAAAAIALVNVDGAVVAYNEIREPARRVGETGGISAVDIESNNTDDYVRGIKIFNNKIYYGRANMPVAGNAILGQNVYNTPNADGLFIANNLIDGWEGNNLDADRLCQNIPVCGMYRGLAAGLYLLGQWPNGVIVANTVIRAQHAGAAFHAAKHLRLEDNLFLNGGGGGIGGWTLFAGTEDNVFVKNRLITDPNITGSTSNGTACFPGAVNNTFVNHEPAEGEECRAKN